MTLTTKISLPVDKDNRSKDSSYYGKKFNFSSNITVVDICGFAQPAVFPFFCNILLIFLWGNSPSLPHSSVV